MRRIVPIVLLCLLALVPTSCKKAKLRAQLRELMGSTIVLPEKISCVYNGEVYPMPDSLLGKAKLIVYIDSAECTACRISHIEMYHELFHISEEYESFAVMLLLSNINLNGIPVIRYLSDLGIEHPVYVDVDNEFLMINPVIPEDNRMHAFFISKTGTPLCVGDPVVSEKMLQIFRELVDKLTTNN